LNDLRNGLKNIDPAKILENLKNSYVPISDNEKCKLIEVKADNNGKDKFKFEKKLNDDESQYFIKWANNHLNSEMSKNFK
jgi:hypothetical protein